MSGAVVDRLARSPAFRAWLPVAVLPPILVADALLVHDGPEVTAWGAVAAVVGCLPLVLRARLGFFALAPLLTAGIVLVLRQLEPGNTVVLIPMVALVELAARSDRRHNLWAGLAVGPCVLISVLPFADDASQLLSIVVRNLALCLLAIAVGDVVRSRREAVDRLVAQREEEAQRRLGEERLRIAREVHDVVAHAMVAINVQAGVAAHRLDRDPEQARTALRAIKDTSGEALADLRATLGVLRGGEDAPVLPAAGLGDLDDLAAGLRGAGVDVDLAVGDVAGLPAAVHAAGYRIVQEALTNVLRHAGARHVRVRVGRDGEAVRLEVRDDGAGAPADRNGNGDGAGSGVRGMRERASALRGTLEAGPADGGGWRVLATLPAETGGAAA
jgi:signal transduction histidine kinase